MQWPYESTVTDLIFKRQGSKYYILKHYFYGAEFVPFLNFLCCLQYSTETSPRSGEEQLAASGMAVKAHNRTEILH